MCFAIAVRRTILGLLLLPLLTPFRALSSTGVKSLTGGRGSSLVFSSPSDRSLIRKLLSVCDEEGSGDLFGIAGSARCNRGKRCSAGFVCRRCIVLYICIWSKYSYELPQVQILVRIHRVPQLFDCCLQFLVHVLQ